MFASSFCMCYNTNMKINASYSCRIIQYRHIFKETVQIYRDAVDFFIDVCLREWEQFSGLKYQTESTTVMERLTVITKNRISVPYDFAGADKRFYKMPCYLRRSAIAEAYGKVCSYMSNFSNWEAAETSVRGKCPSLPKAGYVYPVLYKDNMYACTDNPYIFKVKVYIHNTWDWLAVRVRKSDVDYIKRHCASQKQLSPTLQKRGKVWSLDFAFEEKVTIPNTPIVEQTVLAVDLGIKNACTCSVMSSDGTILGKRFLKLPREYDSLWHVVGKIKKAQRLGARNPKTLWARAKGLNDRISVLTAQFIIDTAVLYNVDVIVMEHLDLQHKKRGSKKQRLALWRAKYVQAMVEHKAHANGMRVSHVNAWGTSRLAYDGSGKILRGKESERTYGNYSICEFQNGKIYNCDLNASYNIGARYFIRELIKPLPVTVRLLIEAKVPQCSRRSTCTLSTLISLHAALLELAPKDAESGLYGGRAVRCA